MTRWVGYQRTRAGDDLIWDGDFHFGDWLAFASAGMAAHDYPGATTSKDLIATAFFAHSTDLLQRAAQVLGKTRTRRATPTSSRRSRPRSGGVRERGGRVGEGTQTAYVLALQFDLLPEELRAAAARRLAEEVRTRKHLTTGFLGTPYLCHVLSRYGYLDEAYLLLNREEYPSWLYPVKQGATTIWERWDGQKPDGSFQDAAMNSFNHYAYGAIGEWMYRVMAGIDVDEAAPGYKHILIQPRPGGGFTSVKASHETPYGKVARPGRARTGASSSVEVPPNTRATVRLPKAQLASVTEGGQAARRRQRHQRPTAGRRRRRRRGRLGPVPVRLPWRRDERVDRPSRSTLVVLVLGALLSPGLPIISGRRRSAWRPASPSRRTRRGRASGGTG